MHSSAQPNRDVLAPASTASMRRRRSLPATTLPAATEDRRGWGVLSFLLHLAIVALLIWTPERLHTGVVIERPQGAGGAGPAGGGGGGRRGTGGIQERVRYVEVVPAPQPTPVAPLPKAVIPPPVVTKPDPIPPTPPIKPPELTPEVKPPELKVADVARPADASAPVPGNGGGTGHDGSAGNGPGSGGGVGSGIGPGRGSGVGPGTGGGVQANYPPTPTEMFIPPLPYPDKVRGFHLVAEYDVDSTGKVVDFKFTPTRDGGYNKRLDEVLRNFKFRPGTKPDGTPIRMKAQITYDF